MDKERRKRPNIVLILADDMGFSDLGCFGSEIDTKNLDALADKGLRFSQMYNVARCCPSRASLLTGLYPHQAGMGFMTGALPDPAYQGYLNNRCVTIAEALKEAGYRTGMAGKWHVGGEYGRRSDWREISGSPSYPTPMQRGFDRFYGTLEGAADYFQPMTLMEDGQKVEVKPEDDFYYTEKIGAKAGEMIAAFAKEQNPFFLYVAFNAPHWPLHAREADIRKYEGKYLAGWDEIRARRYRRQVEMGLIEDIWDISPRDSDAPAWETVTDAGWEDIKMAVYAAQVEEMDRAVGEIIAQLNACGQLDDTLILFTSDNGACAEELPADGWIKNYARDYTMAGNPVHCGSGIKQRPGSQDTYMSYGLPWANASNTPFRLFKHWIHEGGIAAPTIVYWPGQISTPGAIKHMPLHFCDILPTFLEAAGAGYPQRFNGQEITPLSGLSFLPAFKGEYARSQPIYWEHEGNCGMRWGKYKLVRQYPGGFELYDIEADRTELHDLAGDYPGLVRDMEEAYRRWAKEVGVLEIARVFELAREQRGD